MDLRSNRSLYHFEDSISFVEAVSVIFSKDFRVVRVPTRETPVLNCTTMAILYGVNVDV